MTIWLERIFLVLIFSLGFMQPALTLSRYRLPATDLLFVVSAAIFALLLVFRKDSFRTDPIYKYLAAYILAIAFSAVLSNEFSTSLVKFVGVVYLVGLTVLTINIVSSEVLLRSVALTWVYSSTVVCIIGVLTILLFYVDRSNSWHTLFLHHYGSLPVANYPRIQSTFIYPAMLCNYLTVGFLLTLASRKAGWIGAKACLTIASMHCLAALFTFTPGLGGFMFAGAIWVSRFEFAAHQKLFRSLAASTGIMTAVASILVSALSFWAIQTSPYSFSFLGTRVDPTQRLLTWQGALDTFLNFPIFGKGLGLGVANVRFLAPSGQMQLLTDAHNVWLSVAGQAGLVGLTALIVLTIAIIHRSRLDRLSSDTLKPIRQALLIAFISSFIIQGLVGSFEDARHLWVLIGLMIAASRITPCDERIG